MIRLIECENPMDAPTLLGRKEEVQETVDAAVAAILADVKARGEVAVNEYTKKFDGATITQLELPAGEMEAAKVRVDKAFLSVLAQAAENIRLYHAAQLRPGYSLTPRPGVVMGQRILPLERVGVYIPGGTARYPSSALMNVIPAKLAGVDEVLLVTPPDPDGSIPDDILAAAAVAGADRIFLMGGAQAVGALSYGAGPVPRVDKIVGPGNIYVATAKRMVYGLVDIDMIAGPSEVLIISDSKTNPAHIAADLLSQAEHDELAAAILVTTDRRLAARVSEEVEAQLKTLKRESTARASIDDNGAIFIVKSMEDAVAVSNAIAPEHLELCVDEPFALLPSIRHAGSVFLGRHTTEALGDYFAGPNHTLPTNGTARFSSPLGVSDFIKSSSFLYYDGQAMANVAESVAMFADREGLDAHAKAARSRGGQNI
ncbi:MAG: histidinol dehydrogenase [Oscillospiraceae bacterium]|nr:histidinol dehydrogenase [Oscillospiraceae bacterium]